MFFSVELLHGREVKQHEIMDLLRDEAANVVLMHACQCAKKKKKLKACCNCKA